jgi:gamma-glutamylcyclotransferase (GGCT)/AIG2-like uncharacterized protein YtfP
MLYFAYGSNMSLVPMRQRCPDAENLGLAVLHRHRFFIMANGYASVVPQLEGIVQGVLWRVSPSDLVALDVYEDVEGGLYRREMLPVICDGRSVSALVYIGAEPIEGVPRQAYMDLVIQAARENGLPEDYIEALSRHLPRRVDAGSGTGDAT